MVTSSCGAEMNGAMSLVGTKRRSQYFRDMVAIGWKADQSQNCSD
jgi:hypothetical protein